ncbi:pyridoxal-phosphate dependent enzyme [Streptomyces sp. NPDC001127]|uniref:pyridoxal-phosphate dependent enzyme n=1 Tax=Streptomyces sp. NPDC001127 TaxID=3154377 RepID=UPI0033242B44
MLTQAMPRRRIGGVLDMIGATPLVELSRIFPDFPSRVFAKLEKFNPGGSVKDRVALNMLLAKVRSCELVPGRSTVVESSSGNLAIGLAQVCRYFGLRFICVVDANGSPGCEWGSHKPSDGFTDSVLSPVGARAIGTRLHTSTGLVPGSLHEVILSGFIR